MNEERKNLNNFQYFLLFFFIYAFIGWLLETFYAFYELGHFTKRGFLFGPICPLYGYGALILIAFLNKYKNSGIKLFLISAIVFSIFEYIAGYALDAMFADRWWDYTGELLNLNGRISLFFSIAWGVIAILFINHIHPFIEKKTNKLLSKIPYWIQFTVLKLLFIYLVTDTFLSSIKYLKI